MLVIFPLFKFKKKPKQKISVKELHTLYITNKITLFKKICYLQCLYFQIIVNGTAQAIQETICRGINVTPPSQVHRTVKTATNQEG